jgi:uncharacterized membrane protein
MTKNLIAAAALSLIITGTSIPAMSMGERYQESDRHETKKYHALASIDVNTANRIRQTLKGGKKEQKVVMEELKTLYNERSSLLVAETFDADAYRDTTMKINKVKNALRIKKEQQFIALAETLSQSEREALSKFMHQKRNWHGKKERTHKKDSYHSQNGTGIN